MQYSENILAAKGQGSTFEAINGDDLKTLQVPNYPIEKQRQIAARLKAQLAEVDKARQAAETQLRDADVLGQRIFNKIWAELDSVPRKPLGEYAQTTSGSTPARSNKQYWQPAEVAWVKTAEVAFAPITKTEEAISKKALAECSLPILPTKTVLIAMYGQGKTRGQSAILEIPATTNQACFAILPNDAWVPEFLFHWLKFSYQDLRALSEGRGGNQANLNGGLLKALLIPTPDKPTQKVIIARIENVLTEIEANKNGSKAMLNDINLLPQKNPGPGVRDVTMAKKKPESKDQPVSLTQPPAGYAEWLGELKNRIHKAQQRATLAVNRELVRLYWQIGRDILARQAQQGWGCQDHRPAGPRPAQRLPGDEGFFPRQPHLYARLCQGLAG